MRIPGLLRLRGAGTTQMKLSVLPIHPSVHPFIRMPVSSFLRVPNSLLPQFPPPHRGAAALTSLSRCGTLGESGGGGDVGGRPGEAERARVCEPTRLGVCARAAWGAAGSVSGTRAGSPFEGRCAPAAVQM